MKLILFLVSLGLAAQTVTINDTLNSPVNGQKFNGVLTITPQNFTSGGSAYAAVPYDYAVRNGVVNLTLVANSATTPSGTSYRVDYKPSTGNRWTRYWIVPAGGPYTIAQVETAVVAATPALMMALSQLSSGGATDGQCLAYSASSGAWTPGSCAGTSSVSSVFGRSGAVTAQSGDYDTSKVTENTNLYYTDARARGAVSGSGAISYSSSTGVFSCTAASGSVAGCLSSTDWTTFNGKQAAISGAPGTWPTFATVATSGAYSDLTGKPTIPTIASTSNVLKGNGSGGAVAASSGTDFAPATSGSAILKGNGAGGFSSAAAGTDYAAATNGTNGQALTSNGSGGFGTAVTLAASATTDATNATNISSGTLAIARGGTGVGTTSQNYVFAGPTSGSGAPSFRALTAPDIPALSYAATGAIGSSGLTMSTAKLLGRTTASTGAVEEITPGNGVTLSGGSLTTTPVAYYQNIVDMDGNLAIVSANTVYATGAFYVPVRITISTLVLYINTADASACSAGSHCYSLGAYDLNGNRIFTTGAISNSATGWREFSVGSTTVEPGWYLLAYTGSSTSLAMATSGSLWRYYAPYGRTTLTGGSTNGVLPATVTVPAISWNTQYAPTLSLR